ncbi:MAG: N-6 DNA methylase [Cyanobacteria bacterium REEB65]|nr:N-6 DNA methylase [Cyanobacteria bacterium REEB65]
MTAPSKLLGQVFTPPALARKVLDRVAGRPARILDPACGAGHFLQAAAQRWPGAELVGFEVDPAAAALASEWLAGAIEKRDAGAGSRIWQRDALQGDVHPAFDLVCGNPPYGAAFRDPGDRRDLRDRHETTRGSFDMAVPFVERAARWVAPGGWLALVLTNKLFVKDYASALRRWLGASLAIRELWDLAAHDVFEGVQIDAGVLLAQRAGPGSIRIVLGNKTGDCDSYVSDHLPDYLALESRRILENPQSLADSGRWELYRTPQIVPVLAKISGPALADLPGVTIRDGIQGRDYHRVSLVEGELDGMPVVNVGRIDRGAIAWNRSVRHGGRMFVDPRLRPEGAFGQFCESPKILVRGVARRVVAAFCPEPAVPLTAVRAIVVADPRAAQCLVDWLHSELVSFLLQVQCRSDRIPNGSFNISKRWLAALPVPEQPPVLSDEDHAAIAQWLGAYGI